MQHLTDYYILYLLLICRIFLKYGTGNVMNNIKATVDKAVDYITNPDKTEEQLLVSSFGCSPETAELEFAMTHDAARMKVQDRDSNLARHLIISFKPGEITDPQMAHEIGTKIADAVLKGKYEYVLSTHVDKDHYHCHIIFNDVSFVDHHRYRSNKRTYQIGRAHV